MTTALADDQPPRSYQDIRRDIDGYYAEMRAASKAGDRQAYADALADLKAAQDEAIALLKRKVADLPDTHTTTIEMVATTYRKKAS